MLTDRSKAKQGGFAQVRAALKKFEGDVVGAEEGQWGGQMFDDNGKPLPPKEFLEISCVNVEVLETTEELSMPIDEWNFRVNCSEYDGSFWVDKFLEAADRFKIQIPNQLIGKRIIWEKVPMTFSRKDGTEITSENFVIAGIKGEATAKAPNTQPNTQPTTAPSPPQEVPATSPESAQSADPMEIAADVAVGKTEAQFRAAIATNPTFANSPLLAMAKAGAITQTLVNEGRLVLAKEGNKDIYKRP